MTKDFEVLIEELNEILVLSGINTPAGDLVGKRVWIIPNSFSNVNNLCCGKISSVFFSKNDQDPEYYCPFGFCLEDGATVYWEKERRCFFFRSDNTRHPFLCEEDNIGNTDKGVVCDEIYRPYRPVQLRII